MKTNALMMLVALSVPLCATTINLTFDINIENVHDYSTGTDSGQMFGPRR